MAELPPLSEEEIRDLLRRTPGEVVVPNFYTSPEIEGEWNYGLPDGNLDHDYSPSRYVVRVTNRLPGEYTDNL